MESSESTVTIPALQQMKPARQKIVGVVAWDFQIAQIVDRAGVDIVSVGDSVGTNLWGHPSPLAITMDEMMVVCKAVRRGVKRAIVSCDLPFGPLQEGIDSALRFMDACGINLTGEDTLHQVDFWTSHEALILDYEEALTRREMRVMGPSAYRTVAAGRAPVFPVRSELSRPKSAPDTK